MNKNIQFINLEGLAKNPAFSQLVITQGVGKTIYIGGQNSVNAKGEIIGKNDIRVQTEQVMQNIQTALTAAKATFDDIVKLSIYILQGQNPIEAFEASQKFISKVANPPAITGLIVAGLANPDFLIEVEAIAFLPE